jgi:hypothetical protein
MVRYHGQEDTLGNIGSAYGDDLQNYIDGENLNGQDVVIWYCHHHPADLRRLSRRPQPAGSRQLDMT